MLSLSRYDDDDDDERYIPYVDTIYIYSVIKYLIIIKGK